jgi:hypothetical protein
MAFQNIAAPAELRQRHGFADKAMRRSSSEAPDFQTRPERDRPLLRVHLGAARGRPAELFDRRCMSQ